MHLPRFVWPSKCTSTAVCRSCSPLLLLTLLVGFSVSAQGADGAGETGRKEEEQQGYRGDGSGLSLFVPRIHRPPTLDDFADMRPSAELRESLALATGFVQRIPTDGADATRRTEVWLAHDETALHAVFVAWDDDPDAIRGRMARREDIGADDIVTITLDTFHDRQRAYEFSTNPLGIQRDALWTEGRTTQGDDNNDGAADTSFDTLWNSTGRITDQGYVVVMSIPFKSLRFPRADSQTWGIVLWRWTPRGSAEETTWPHVSTRLEGVLNQAATITGFEDISPGRNIRLIPYGTVRSFRTLDETPNGPDFVTDPVDPAAGIDAKFVVKDAIVVDATANPDFSQVESDQPQLTVNQRFEVFFPEKRPFFLENANYFETPFSLLFTRRIANPQFGLRATGKMGGWAVGALGIDDRAPGKVVDETSPLSGARARHGVVRVSRDLPNQSNVGLMYVDRDLHDTYNRVGGVDGRIKLGRNWVTSFQAVSSSTRTLDGDQLSGPAYYARVERAGRKFNAELTYKDISQDFRADTGFVPRTGIRQIDGTARYRFRPEGDVLIAHGPTLQYTDTYDRSGERLDRAYNPSYNFGLPGQTNFGAWGWIQDIRLRPEDFSSLVTDRQYEASTWGFWFDSAILKSLEVSTWQGWGTAMNFVPAAGQQPEVGRSQDGEVVLTFRPNDRLRLSGRWLHAYLDDDTNGAPIFRSDVYRARIDWQFNRELSLRVIGQYESVEANPELTSLETTDSINADVLVTYLVNPWTALYVGYNSNRQNLELLTRANGNVLRRTDGRFLNDANQLFVKLSYLFSY